LEQPPPSIFDLRNNRARGSETRRESQRELERARESEREGEVDELGRTERYERKCEREEVKKRQKSPEDICESDFHHNAVCFPGSSFIFYFCLPSPPLNINRI